jgi:uncharacterized protein
VNDYAGLLSAADRERLDAQLAERERAAGTQMAIAIFPSLEGENVEDVASELFKKWRLGQKGLDNGLLLVLFVKDRKLRIEVGYGLESVVTDAVASQIIRREMAPRFREARWAEGLAASVDAVYARISAPNAGRLRGEAQAFRRSQRRHEDTASLYLILFLALFGGIVASLAWEASRQRHGFTAGRAGVDRTSGGWGGWYIGGGGGGWSGGGGGGFSGGGGESGGGGASGDW